VADSRPDPPQRGAFAPLKTLVLAMPVSWKGTLQQYAGRLHREHASKSDVRILDFVAKTGADATMWFPNGQ
jgi:superfamily II DNA or RNA helicase